MAEIKATAKAFKKKAAAKDIVDEKADQAITQIDNDIATLDGSPTNADVIAIVRRSLVREKKIIRYLANLD